MVNIGRCSSCGTYISELFATKDNCKDCGGSIDHIKVELGPVEHLPRLFNILGGLFFVIGLFLFLLSFSENGIGSMYLLLMVVGILSFIGSLVSNQYLVKKAIAKRSAMKIGQKRTRKDQPGPDIKKGKVEANRKIATKVVLKK
jgi:uncharacterized protein (DUF983 family)